MTRYIFNRIIQMLPVLFGATLIVFIMGHVVPGDPVQTLLGTQYTQEQYEQLMTHFGLDKPLYVQYWKWISRAVQGDLGRSILSGRLVLKEILDRLPATLTLAFAAFAITLILSIPIGVIAAYKQDTSLDHVSTVGSLFGVSMPSFWEGLMIILLFSLYIGWFPSGSRGEPPDLIHLVLPAFVLGTEPLAVSIRLVRTAMLEVLREEYITAARAKGLREGIVIFKHALKNSLIPVVTNSGLLLSRLLGGSVVIEVVFAWPGIGRLAYNGIIYRDFPVVQGVVLLLAIIFLFLNLIVDIFYAYIDPRIKYD